MKEFRHFWLRDQRLSAVVQGKEYTDPESKERILISVSPVDLYGPKVNFFLFYFANREKEEQQPRFWTKIR